MTDIQYLGKKQKDIFLTIEKLGESTDAEIAQHLNIPINTVTPRRNELMQMDYVVHVRNRICNVTKQKVKSWGVIGQSQKQTNSMEDFF